MVIFNLNKINKTKHHQHYFNPMTWRLTTRPTHVSFYVVAGKVTNAKCVSHRL